MAYEYNTTDFTIHGQWLKPASQYLCEQGLYVLVKSIDDDENVSFSILSADTLAQVHFGFFTEKIQQYLDGIKEAKPLEKVYPPDTPDGKRPVSRAGCTRLDNLDWVVNIPEGMTAVLSAQQKEQLYGIIETLLVNDMLISNIECIRNREQTEPKPLEEVYRPDTPDGKRPVSRAGCKSEPYV